MIERKKKSIRRLIYYVLSALAIVISCVAVWNLYQGVFKNLKDWHHVTRMVIILLVVPLLVKIKKILFGFKVSNLEWSVTLILAGIGGIIFLLS